MGGMGERRRRGKSGMPPKKKKKKETGDLGDEELGPSTAKKVRFGRSNLRRGGVEYGEDDDIPDWNEEAETKEEWAHRIIADNHRPGATQPRPPTRKGLNPSPVWLLKIFVGANTKRLICLMPKCVKQPEVVRPKGNVGFAYAHLQYEHPKLAMALRTIHPRAESYMSTLGGKIQGKPRIDQMKDDMDNAWTKIAEDSGDQRVSMLVPYKPTKEELYGELKMGTFDLPGLSCTVCRTPFGDDMDAVLRCQSSHSMVELERIYDEHRFPVTSECKRQVNVTGKYFNIKERQLLEGCAVYAVIHDPAFRLIGAGRQLNTLEFVRLVGYFGKYEVHSLDPVWRRLSGHVADGERLAWRSVRFPNNKHPIGGMPKRDQNASRPIVFNWERGKNARLIPMIPGVVASLCVLFESMFVDGTFHGMLGSEDLCPVICNKELPWPKTMSKLRIECGHEKANRIARQLYIEAIHQGTVFLHRSMNDQKYMIDWRRDPRSHQNKMIVTAAGKFRTESTANVNAQSQTPPCTQTLVQLGIGTRADNTELEAQLGFGLSRDERIAVGLETFEKRSSDTAMDDDDQVSEAEDEPTEEMTEAEERVVYANWMEMQFHVPEFRQEDKLKWASREAENRPRSSSVPKFTYDDDENMEDSPDMFPPTPPHLKGIRFPLKKNDFPPPGPPIKSSKKKLKFGSQNKEDD